MSKMTPWQALLLAAASALQACCGGGGDGAPGQAPMAPAAPPLMLPSGHASAAIPVAAGCTDDIGGVYFANAEVGPMLACQPASMGWRCGSRAAGPMTAHAPW